MKDYDNEIDILNEAIERLKAEERDNPRAILSFEEQREIAISKLNKIR